MAFSSQSSDGFELSTPQKGQRTLESFQLTSPSESFGWNTKMRFLPVFKGAFSKRFKKDQEEPEEDNFHRVPAGEYPRNGPKSSIIAIVMFYISKIMTIIGLVLVARAVWFEEVSKFWLICPILE